jgi:hypothetical protein
MKWGFNGKSVERYTIFPKEKTLESSPSTEKKRTSGISGSALKRLRGGLTGTPPFL